MDKLVTQNGTYLFVVPWELDAIGGVSGVVRSLSNAMAETGSLKPLIGINTWENRVPARSGDTIRFRFTVIGSQRLACLDILKALVKAPLCLWHTHQLLRKLEVQAVNFHYPGFGPLALVLLKIIGLFQGKLLLSFHGTDVSPPSGHLERLIQSFIIRSADNVVACSRSLAARISQEFDIPVSSVDVILNGVDSSVYSGVTNSAPQLPQELPPQYIVSVGAFIPRKNHTLLLEAFMLLKDRYPALHLCIVGGDGNERRTIEESIKTHDLNERVLLFVDLNQTQVALVLSKAAVCVQAAIAEAFPLAVLEASASGVPLVISDIPPHREQVQDKQTGLFFPLGEPLACANSISALLDDPEKAAQMALEQKTYVCNNLTWQSSTQQYEELVMSS
jgi:glycosyltransferase involved in cell wall biosynthesis